MILAFRWALAASVLSILGFCVLGLLATLQSPGDCFCPCVYSVLIALYGTGVARLLSPVLQSA
jgi:hypothetical protein